MPAGNPMAYNWQQHVKEAKPATPRQRTAPGGLAGLMTKSAPQSSAPAVGSVDFGPAFPAPPAWSGPTMGDKFVMASSPIGPMNFPSMPMPQPMPMPQGGVNFPAGGGSMPSNPGSMGGGVMSSPGSTGSMGAGVMSSPGNPGTGLQGLMSQPSQGRRGPKPA